VSGRAPRAGAAREPVGVVLVGVGDHARRNVLPALRACGATRLVGVSSRSARAREEAAAELGCASFASLAEALCAPDVDAVYVATPVGCHAEAVRAALAAGRAVFCEKSLTASPATSRELVGEARRRGLPLCEAFMFRFHRQLGRVAELVAEGAVGGVRSVSARFGIPPLAPENVRHDPELGGGALLDVGGYCVCAVRRILGPSPARVSAALGRREGYRVDTDGAALLAYAEGPSALLDWGFARAYRNEIEVWGEAGVLRAERIFSKPADLATRVHLRLGGGEERAEEIPPQNHFVTMLETFAATLHDPTLREQEWTEIEAQTTLLARLLTP
jgi:NDP-hexose-3-ketoreductase